MSGSRLSRPSRSAISLAHKMGIVDDGYLKATGDTKRGIGPQDQDRIKRRGAGTEPIPHARGRALNKRVSESRRSPTSSIAGYVYSRGSLDSAIQADNAGGTSVRSDIHRKVLQSEITLCKLLKTRRQISWLGVAVRTPPRPESRSHGGSSSIVLRASVPPWPVLLRNQKIRRRAISACWRFWAVGS